MFVGVEGDLIHDALNDRVQTASTNILNSGIDLKCHPCNLPDGLISERELDFLSTDEGDLLAHQVRLRHSQDEVHVLLRERFQFDPDR